jgi:predicted metal-binding membrane protein
MDALIILLVAGAAMALFAIAVMAIYTFLEAEQKNREIRRYVRKQIMKQLERDKEI